MITPETCQNSPINLCYNFTLRDPCINQSDCTITDSNIILSLPIVFLQTKLVSLLPRESSSKEVDAGLLTIISYPAFAASTTELCDATRTEVISKLEVSLCAHVCVCWGGCIRMWWIRFPSN